nr:MAG TPA: hypothetical protein [Caudoviricetes sp.]
MTFSLLKSPLFSPCFNSKGDFKDAKGDFYFLVFFSKWLIFNLKRYFLVFKRRKRRFFLIPYILF